MEIERKWLVSGWPKSEWGLPLIKEHAMEQGYISTLPTVRLRKEALVGGETEYILCFKSGKGLVREEIELQLSPETFSDLAQKIMAKPMIVKQRRSYALPDGRTLEVSEVDKGQPTAFYYAEIEFETEAEALQWKAESMVEDGQGAQSLQKIAQALARYLSHEVTHEKGQSMAEYWAKTRG